MPTITRKIQISVDTEDKDVKNKHYETLKDMNFNLMRAANEIATHQFVMENTPALIYMEDGTKAKLADKKKDVEGILTTSRMNTTYQLLSKKYLEKVPSTFLTSLNSQIVSVFNSEKKDYYTGKKSLRNYKRSIPMPFQKTALRDFVWDKEKKQFTFTLAKIPFKTYLGQDRSGNRIIINRCLSGEYTMSDSALKFEPDKNKWFLLLTFKFDKQNVAFTPDKNTYAWLDIETPIKVKCEDDEKNIGSKEEYLYRRMQIQAARRRLQVACKYNDGSGRKRKLQALDRFIAKEADYIKARMHLYSKMLIDFALKNKSGKIMIANFEEAKDNAEEEKFLLRNWNYYGLSELVKYKAAKYGIAVELH